MQLMDKRAIIGLDKPVNGSCSVKSCLKTMSGGYMNSSVRKGWQSIVHPYNFALKEGLKIRKNPLDYSLMIMLVTPNQTLPSPKKKRLQHATAATAHSLAITNCQGHNETETA